MNFQGIEPPVESRFQRMMRHTWLVVIAATLAAVGLGAVGFYYANRPTTLTTAVGPPNSDDLKIMQAFAAHFARERAPIRLRVIVKDDVVGAAQAIDKREADVPCVRRARAMPQEGQAVAVLRKNVVVLAAPPPPPPAAANSKAKRAKKGAKEEEKKKIEKIEDLAGHRIGVIGRS